MITGLVITGLIITGATAGRRCLLAAALAVAVPGFLVAACSGQAGSYGAE